MIFLFAAAGFIWAFIMLMFAPLWQKAICFIPVCIYGVLYIHPAFAFGLAFSVIPLLVGDIQIVPDGLQMDGVWKYLAYLPSGMVAVIALYIIHPYFDKSDWLRAIGGFTFALVMVTWGLKILVIDPILLFVNRIGASEVETLEKQFVKLEQRSRHRNANYFIKLYAYPELKVSGLCYLYVYFRNLAPGDILKFKFKRGRLGIKYMSGFPVIQRVVH
ncbi:hypothetical protein ABDD95_16765 [Mucilaginibacter sp. PAMB04274]|uniref:hypothetical protein n=1 Tax=Mucilaginibacter sp. PAMB04274 TaxID=3138568 RepID=UPI0031F6B617